MTSGQQSTSNITTASIKQIFCGATLQYRQITRLKTNCLGMPCQQSPRPSLQHSTLLTGLLETYRRWPTENCSSVYLKQRHLQKLENEQSSFLLELYHCGLNGSNVQTDGSNNSQSDLWTDHKSNCTIWLTTYPLEVESWFTCVLVHAASCGEQGGQSEQRTSHTPYSRMAWPRCACECAASTRQTGQTSTGSWGSDIRKVSLLQDTRVMLHLVCILAMITQWSVLCG